MATHRSRLFFISLSSFSHTLYGREQGDIPYAHDHFCVQFNLVVDIDSGGERL